MPSTEKFPLNSRTRIWYIISSQLLNLIDFQHFHWLTNNLFAWILLQVAGTTTCDEALNETEDWNNTAGVNLIQIWTTDDEGIAQCFLGTMSTARHHFEVTPITECEQSHHSTSSGGHQNDNWRTPIPLCIEIILWQIEIKNFLCTDEHSKHYGASQ